MLQPLYPPSTFIDAPAAPAPVDPTEAARQFDRLFHARVAEMTGGLSRISLALAWQDWAMHLAAQPAQALRLAVLAQSGALEWLTHCATPQDCAEPDSDPRFAGTAWQHWPWNMMAQGYHQAEKWWDAATRIDGPSRHHAEMVRAFSRQLLDTMSPSNLPFNPEVQQATLEQHGANLAAGAANALDDWRKDHGLDPLQPQERAYRPGVEVAVTPGAVVYRNRLVELIQYHPTTDQVQAEPVFIVPSWIMKYYILDLSPQNSMVRWLTSQGHTVFILSWKNPDKDDADIGFNDYLQWGIFDSLAAIRRLVPDQKVHACGYCLGGTLLSIAAAALARPQQVANAADQAPLASVSLLATEVDFAEPGELGIFIDEAQVKMLEAMMSERGFLSGRQMSGSFQFLHARDLIWSTRMREYLLGERSQPNDLMAWNADVTRMPARMHSEYLRRCYLANQLALGTYQVEGQPVSLGDIRVPVFLVGTEKDHVSPWRSVYQLHRLADTELTFVLTSGGHNAGIVSEPGHKGRRYAIHTTAATDTWQSPDAWQQTAERREGSWWTAWHEWMSQRSSGQVPARAIPPSAVIAPAPGQYVQIRYHD